MYVQPRIMAPPPAARPGGGAWPGRFIATIAVFAQPPAFACPPIPPLAGLPFVPGYLDFDLMRTKLAAAREAAAKAEEAKHDLINHP